MNKYNKALILFIIVIVSSCATYKTNYKEDNGYEQKISNKSIDKRFYLIGDAGNAVQNESTKGLSILKQLIDTTETSEDYLLFLGDNIYQKGMPSKKSDDRLLAEHRINAQLDAAKSFKGKVVFIPGNHDWYADGIEGLLRQQKYIEKETGTKNSFLPSNGCPIASVTINEDIQLILLDTQWYFANWNKNPSINDECEIKTREGFFTELEGEFKKNRNKRIVLALHHPMYTNGVHGGKFGIDKHLFPSNKKIPLPILGSLSLLIRANGGVTTQDLSSKRYNYLKQRLSTMLRGLDNVVLVSGHEHSLQYINNKGLKQIVSGSGSKSTASTLAKDGLFAHSGQGLAILDVYKDGSSNVRFYANVDNAPKLLYQTNVFDKKEVYKFTETTSKPKKEALASIYNKEEVQKSKLHKGLWGDHYRYVYGTDIKMPTATLDTLLGGLTVDRLGGGQVTKSLRLIDPNGKRYVLRAMRKSATQFLQKGVFKKTHLQDEFHNTYIERLLSDFYTSSYPYAFLTVGDLANSIGVYHTNPKVYFIPKHKELGVYNEIFGNQICFLEERPSKDFNTEASFGKPSSIVSTSNFLSKLRKSKKHTVDESHYIRTRLFDMILGDWDRHSDQWRWARFDSLGKHLYRPVPKDRDQVFSNYDGLLLDAMKLTVPLTRKFQVYDASLKKVKWINQSGLPLDRALLQNSDMQNWINQATYIKENLSDSIIDIAFSRLPLELQDNTLSRIKSNLKSRRDKIEKIAVQYYMYLSKHSIITGTDKEDYFEIKRSKNTTSIRVSRIKKGKIQDPYIHKIFNKKMTKEIWIYGLDDKDQFEIKGKGKNLIKIRIVGGQNKDSYTIENGKKIKVYDHRAKPNKIIKKGGANFKFTNMYNFNLYDFKKRITRRNKIIPFVGYNPDDGLNFNFVDNYTVTGFKNEPYHSKHRIKAAYYYLTKGYDISYNAEFVKALGNFNFLIEGKYTSENFAQNFFGLGNESINNDDEFSFNYNRVKTGIWSFGLGVSKKGYNGSRLSVKANLEGIQVQNSDARYITSGLSIVSNDPLFFKRKYFTNLDVNYTFENYDNAISPAKGMFFNLTTGARSNINYLARTYGYVYTKLGFYNALTRNQKLVLKSTLVSKTTIGNDYEFYQGATLGGTNTLRGYREERFVGKYALSLSGDIRYSFNRIKTGLVPLQFGVFSGYDLGRVWLNHEYSSKWHDSVGGGFWINAIDVVGAQLGLFASNDGYRFTFGFGLSL